MADTGQLNLKSRVQTQQKKKIRKIRVYHSFLTIVLLMIIFQISYSALLNFAKIVVYQSKIAKAADLYTQAESRNKHLKNEIQNFSSMYKVEEIARNNLKMAAKNEVLIIINQPNDEQKKEGKFYNNEIFQFFENFVSKFNNEKTID